MPIEFERQEQRKLVEWVRRTDRMPLILDGVRQVGKTHLMKWLGRTHFDRTAYFNFDEQPELCQFFERTKQVSQLLRDLSIVAGFPLDERTLIILDEIQSCQPALNSLKYFQENAPHLPVISAGSLLGVSLGAGRSFPVGKVQFLSVHPLRFHDVLKQADPELHAAWEGYWETAVADPERNHSANPFPGPIPEFFFNPLKKHFKLHVLVGGLPRVAATFLETLDLNQSDRVLDEMIESYIRDFAKHPLMSHVAKIEFVWRSLPSQLARENKKFLYQLVRSGARAREYEDALLWLVKAGLTHKIHRTTTPKLPLSAYDDLRAFKLYCFDTGVLRRMSRLDPAAYLTGDRLFTEFKGSLVENAILEALVPQLDAIPRYYATKHGTEVDFLVQRANDILPVEVKSEDHVKSRSLTLYERAHHPRLRIRFSLRNLSYRNGLLNIPHMLADRAMELIGLALQAEP